MIYISNNSTNPYYNLALEEYVLKHLNRDENYVLLWQNRPSIIIGKFQNTIEEINSDFVKENNIYVVRRMSGGGAVYHDLGNLNFTFIVKKQPNKLFDFKEYTIPVMKTLKELDVDVKFSSRNDLTIDGKKFSGNAQYIYKNRLLHHGTILFNSDLSVLQNALKVSPDKIESKGIKSVRSRVANIIDYLKDDITIDEFKSLLLKNIFEENPITEYKLSPQDEEKIQQLVKEKYETWEWNYGESPEYNMKKSRRFNTGKIEVRLNVKDGFIKECKIYGDFFGVKDVSEIEEKLKGEKFKEDNIISILKEIDLTQYFGEITLEEFLTCFF